MPGTNYDRFFAEEFCKKLKTNEELDQFIDKLRDVTDSDLFKQTLEGLIANV
jgi:hypothetical protein